MITPSQAIHICWSAITLYISWPQFGVRVLKAHLRGDGIDLSRESGSINKQWASDFKAEETYLYFSRRVCIWIPELGCGPGQIVGCIFLADLTAGPAPFLRPTPVTSSLLFVSIKVNKGIVNRKLPSNSQYVWERSVLKQQINSISRTSISALQWRKTVLTLDP